MKVLLNNSFFSYNDSLIENQIGLYNNYFILVVENNLGIYIYLNKLSKFNLLNINLNKKNIYFFKKNNLNVFFKNFMQSIISIYFGYYIELVLVGLGYKIHKMRYLRRSYLVFDLHYSHQLIYKIPVDIIVKLSKKNIILFGLSKEKLINISTFIINFRFPNVYKGKGIRYLNQIIKLKPGKQR